MVFTVTEQVLMMVVEYLVDSFQYIVYSCSSCAISVQIVCAVVPVNRVKSNQESNMLFIVIKR